MVWYYGDEDAQITKQREPMLHFKTAQEVRSAEKDCAFGHVHHHTRRPQSHDKPPSKHYQKPRTTGSPLRPVTLQVPTCPNMILVAFTHIKQTGYKVALHKIGFSRALKAIGFSGAQDVVVPPHHHHPHTQGPTPNPAHPQVLSLTNTSISLPANLSPTENPGCFGCFPKGPKYQTIGYLRFPC